MSNGSSRGSSSKRNVGGGLASRLGKVEGEERSGVENILAHIRETAYVELVAQTARLGGLCSLGTTMARDAIVLSILLDGETVKEYVKSPDDFADTVQRWFQALDDR